MHRCIPKLISFSVLRLNPVIDRAIEFDEGGRFRNNHPPKVKLLGRARAYSIRWPSGGLRSAADVTKIHWRGEGHVFLLFDGTLGVKRSLTIRLADDMNSIA